MFRDSIRLADELWSPTVAHENCTISDRVYYPWQGADVVASFVAWHAIASVGGLTSWVCAALPITRGTSWLDLDAASVSTAYVVDDEASIRNALRRLLNAHGIAMKAYASAETFLVDAGHLRDGCLLLDINMPGLTGIELLGQLRSKNWHLPTVLMTAVVDGSLREKATQAGAFALLEKPFHVDVLLSTMEQAVIQHRSKADADTG